MPEIVRDEKFLVHEQGNSAWNGKTVKRRVWFEVLEGEDSGIRVSIPLWDDSYDDATRERLSELVDGHVVRATIRRQGPSDQWKPTEPPEIVSRL